MKCNKVKHKTREAARIAADVVAEKNGNNKRLRVYKCKECDAWHFSRMSKRQHRIATSPDYRTELNEKRFINSWARYYESKFGIDH